jgi:hypothetical protein
MTRDADEAKEHFKRWRWQANTWNFDSNAIQLGQPKPIFLPFFAFEAGIDVTFDGSIGYTTMSHQVTQNGETIKKTVWYSKAGIKVPRQHFYPSAQTPYMMQYAGFEFRRRYINACVSAMLSRSGTNALASAKPLRAAMLPDKCGIHAFEMKPSMAYGA